MNIYLPLQATGQESEYNNTPPLAISSIGIENTKKSTQMPDGSALLTNTGNNSNLKTQGIDFIIHAVPRPRSSCASDEEFIEIAVKAAQNSIFLADREGIKSLAICLIGGETYRGTCDPQKLAEGIIRGAVNQLEKVNNLEEISLIDWKGNSRHYLLEKTIELWKVGELSLLSWDGNETIFDALVFNPKGNRSIVVRAGDICDKNTHGASAIVNSENSQMGWGGGISGNIKIALGAEASSVDQQRKDLMSKFNDLISETDEKGVKISFQVKFTGPETYLNSWGFWKLDSKGNLIPTGDGGQVFINIDKEHPAFKNPPYFWKKTDVVKQDFVPFKITIKKTDEDKKYFKEDDFIEIEEIEKDNKGSNKTCTLCSKNFPAGSGIVFNNKDYCSNECSLKQQEKNLPPPKRNKNDSLNQVQNQAISDINQTLNLEPKLTNSDLFSDYQNWESIIKKFNSESEINQFKEKVLSDIKNKRKNKQDSASRDQKINQAHTETEKINLLKEMGSSLGELTPEQETKLEKIKDDLATNPPQLRDAVQKEIISHLTASGVRAEDLNPATKKQLESLKNETDSLKILTIEKQLIQVIGEKGVELKLTSLTQQVDTVLKDKQKTKIQEVKDKLLELISSPNSFIQTKKSQFQALLQKLEQGGQNQKNTPSASNQPKLPWKIVVPTCLVAVVGIGVLVILLRKKRKSH